MRIVLFETSSSGAAADSWAAHGDLLVAMSPEQAARAIAAGKVDVIVAGFESWGRGWAVSLPPETRPALVLVGAPSIVAQGPAAVADADEWMADGAGAAEIDARLKVAVKRARLRRRAVRRGSVDPLTGLPNRRGVIVALLRGAARSRRQGAHLSLVVLELDHFKRVNEQHGHDGGDRVLRKVGRVLRRATRQDEVCGRIGGDEFAVVVGGDGQHADLVCNRIRAALATEGIGATGAAQELGPAESLRELYRRVDAQLRAHKWEIRTSRPPAP